MKREKWEAKNTREVGHRSKSGIKECGTGSNSSLIQNFPVLGNRQTGEKFSLSLSLSLTLSRYPFSGRKKKWQREREGIEEERRMKESERERKLVRLVAAAMILFLSLPLSFFPFVITITKMMMMARMALKSGREKTREGGESGKQPLSLRILLTDITCSNIGQRRNEREKRNKREREREREMNWLPHNSCFSFPTFHIHTAALFLFSILLSLVVFSSWTSNQSTKVQSDLDILK